MVEPIHHPLKSFLPDSKNIDVLSLAKELKESIDGFNNLLPPRSHEGSVFGPSIENLDRISKKALEMIKNPGTHFEENVQNSARTVQNILTQPLLLTTGQNSSLIAAAKKYHEAPDETSELMKLMVAFIQYPDQTQALKTELLLTSSDLNPS